jgi:hypothetical protein
MPDFIYVILIPFEQFAMRAIKGPCFQLCIIGLWAAIASAGQCSDVKKTPDPNFQAQYNKVFSGNKLVFAVIGGM